MCVFDPTSFWAPHSALWVLSAEGQSELLCFPPEPWPEHWWYLEVAAERQGRQGEMCFLGLGPFCFITMKSLQVNINSFVFNLAVLLPYLLSCLQLTGCHKEVTGQWQFVCHGPLLFELDFYLVMNQAMGVQSGKKRMSQRSKLKLESFSVHLEIRMHHNVLFPSTPDPPVFSQGNWV